MDMKLEDHALVGPDWLAERLDDPGLRLIQVDWVGTEAYDQQHIPGAIGWNWKEWLWDPHHARISDARGIRPAL